MIMQIIRSKETIAFEPKDVIIVEGIFALENKTLRDMMDVKFMLIQTQI